MPSVLTSFGYSLANDDILVFRGDIERGAAYFVEGGFKGICCAVCLAPEKFEFAQRYLLRPALT